mgnify:CR=1 FL=1
MQTEIIKLRHQLELVEAVAKEFGVLTGVPPKPLAELQPVA